MRLPGPSEPPAPTARVPCLAPVRAFSQLHRGAHRSARLSAVTTAQHSPAVAVVARFPWPPPLQCGRCRALAHIAGAACLPAVAAAQRSPVPLNLLDAYDDGALHLHLALLAKGALRRLDPISHGVTALKASATIVLCEITSSSDLECLDAMSKTSRHDALIKLLQKPVSPEATKRPRWSPPTISSRTATQRARVRHGNRVRRVGKLLRRGSVRKKLAGALRTCIQDVCIRIFACAKEG